MTRAAEGGAIARRFRERRDYEKCHECRCCEELCRGERDCVASRDLPFSNDLRFTSRIQRDPLKSQFSGDQRLEKGKKIVDSYDLTGWIAILTTMIIRSDLLLYLLYCNGANFHCDVRVSISSCSSYVD